MSTSTSTASESTDRDMAGLSIDHPTHVAEPDRIIGRFTAPQLLSALGGVLGAVGATQQHGVPLVLRAGEALLIALVGVVSAFWQPGGRSLLAWGRVLLTYRTAPRVFGWDPLAAPTGAALHAADLLPRPPHLPAQRLDTAAAPIPPTPIAAAPGTGPAYAATQDRLYVPLAIDDDTVTLADGQRCATLELSGTGNAELLDAAGQRQLHAAYLEFLRGLTFPVTLLHLVTPVDLGAYAARRAQGARRLPPGLQRLELASIGFMTRSARRLGLVNQRCLLIFSAEAWTTTAPPGLAGLLRRVWPSAPRGSLEMGAPEMEVERERGERLLAERCAALVAALAPAGLYAHRLDTEALRDLWHHQLRPRSAPTQLFRPDHGAAILGTRVVYDGVDDPEDGDDGAAAVLGALLADGSAQTANDEEEASALPPRRHRRPRSLP